MNAYFDNAITLFRFLNRADSFEYYYRQLLARRLIFEIGDVYKNMEFEELMLEKLKVRS